MVPKWDFMALCGFSKKFKKIDIFVLKFVWKNVILTPEKVAGDKIGGQK